MSSRNTLDDDTLLDRVERARQAYVKALAGVVHAQKNLDRATLAARRASDELYTFATTALAVQESTTDAP